MSAPPAPTPRRRACFAIRPHRKLGEGAFAEVYEGRPEPALPPGHPNAKVAIKVTDKRKLNNPRLERILRDEVNLLGSLNGHNNIVRLFQCFEKRDFHHMVLEYCDGGDLGAFLRQRAPLAVDVVRDMLRQIAAGVRHMRERNVVHRDLKPQNILLKTDTTRPCGFCLKIADFGLACQLTDQTMTSTYCGSPLHMAPELVAGGRYDPKVDLWSIGTIAYQMVTGVLPYRAASVKGLRDKLQRAERRSEAVPLPDHLPDSLVSLIRGLLQPRPSDRLSFMAFHTHAFFAVDATPAAHAAPAVTDVAPTPPMAHPYSKPVAETFVRSGADSFCLVDQRVQEFASLLDKMTTATTDVLKDDVRQRSLRLIADNAVADAQALMTVSHGLPPAEALLLQARTLALLRTAIDQARPHMGALAQGTCCQATLVSARRFRRCNDHCIMQLERLRTSALHTDALQPTDSVAQTPYLTPNQATLDAARVMAARAHRRMLQWRNQGADGEGYRRLAHGLYERALRLLRVLGRDASGTEMDQERLRGFVARMAQEHDAVAKRRSSPLGSALSHATQVLGDSDVSVGSLRRAPASRPIAVPGATRQRLSMTSSSRARFCAQCGDRYNDDDNYCGMCGTARQSLVNSSLRQTPRSLASSMPPGHS